MINQWQVARSAVIIVVLFANASVVLAQAQEEKQNSLTIESWATRLASVYYDSRTGNERFRARLGDPTKCYVESLVAWRDALKGKTTKNVKDAELIGLIDQYHPIWKDDRCQKSESETRVARIKFLSQADVKKWQGSLKTVQGNEVSELWTVALIVDLERLFSNDAFNSKESELLLRRLEILPIDTVKALADTLHTAKGQVAILIIQNDSFFDDGGFRQKSFDEGMIVLKEKIAGSKN